jgi:hypothetical protein
VGWRFRPALREWSPIGQWKAMDIYIWFLTKGAFVFVLLEIIVIRALVNSSSVLPKPMSDSDMPKHRMISQWPLNYKYELTVNHIYKVVF